MISQAPFDVFVDRHRDRAVRLAWRLVGDEQAAMDVAQDAFLRAHAAIGSLREVDRLEGWFYRTLVRLAHNHRRWRAVRARFWSPWAEVASPERGPNPGVRDRIDAAIRRLPDGQRDVFVLVHVEQFTVEETAVMLGRAPGTVKSHLQRALTALRVELHDLAGGGHHG